MSETPVTPSITEEYEAATKHLRARTIAKYTFTHVVLPVAAVVAVTYFVNKLDATEAITTAITE